MKVQLKDIKPNPFRHLESYPIDQEKVKRLRQSIKHTGFWDNIVGRKKDGIIEIAYGHHRVEALKKEFPSTHVINIIDRDLDDGMMIKIMADENDEAYTLSPAVIHETIKAVIKYLEDNPKRLSTSKIITREEVCNFLGDGWFHKIKLSWPNIDAIEKKEVVKEIEKLPSIQHAEHFRSIVKETGITETVQKKIIADINKKGIGYRDVKSEVRKYVDQGIKKETAIDILIEAAASVRDLERKLHKVNSIKGELRCGKSFRLAVDLEKLFKEVKVVLERLGILQTGEKNGTEVKNSNRLLVRK